MSQGPTTRAKVAALKQAENANANTTPAPSPSRIPTSKAKQRKAAEEEGQAQETRLDKARKHLSDVLLMGMQDPCTTETFAIALRKIAGHDSAHPEIKKALLSLAHVTVASGPNGFQCSTCERTAKIPEMLETFKVDIMKDLDRKTTSLSTLINGKMATLSGPPDVTGKLQETAANLTKIATSLESKLEQVKDSSEQLANTATSYRDAHLNREPRARPAEGATDTDPALDAATNRKARQVLVQLPEADMEAHSEQTLKEKAMTVIGQITLPPPPEGIDITEVTKLKKGALLLVFNSKEAAEWIQQEDVELEFTVSFIPGAKIRPRQYALLVPRIPLTLDPENDAHIREIEENNDLESGAITKVRWIKPANRRRPDQIVAHAAFLMRTAKDANKCITDGLKICNAKVYPSKLKQEPTQCMKCRRWGHFATDCTQNRDTCGTCGTCGGEHRTNICNNRDRRYCVSCNEHTHASWDRKCPEFAKRCSWYDEKHPDNTLKYFPTNETWTQAVRPERIPIPDRFPARFAVGSLPPPNRDGRELPTRPLSQNQTRPRNRSRRERSQPQEERQALPSQRAAGATVRERDAPPLTNAFSFSSRPRWDDASSFDSRSRFS
jgi:hypothetical protein